jgi:RimJ/RimL family protein N-acetyltransferase
MKIETERLFLRRWRSSDSEPFHRLNSNAAVMEFLLKPLSLEESDGMIARMESHFDQYRFGLWAVETKDSKELIGFTGLSRPTFETAFTPCVEIGWRLGRNAWGKGFATEAARAALAFGFGQGGLTEIVSFTVPANVRSIAVMERIGMKHDLNGDFDHPKVPDGHPLKQHVLYRLRKEQFSKFKKVGAEK